MRIRTLSYVGVGLLLVGGAAWLYQSGTGGQTIGAQGLPIIKADVNPAKVPPEEPGGEVMPNAESTVFSAMGDTGAEDPSMSEVKLPEEGSSAADAAGEGNEFAGFRTGFSIPKEGERKTESLFGAEAETQEKAPEPASGGSKYLSGIAPEAVSGATPEPVVEAKAVEEPAPEPIMEKPAVKSEKPAKAPAKAEAEMPDILAVSSAQEEAAPELPPLAPAGEIVAQSLEAEEKILVRPQAKPPVPKLEALSAAPVEKVEAEATMAQKPAVKTETPEDAAYIPPKKTPVPAMATPAPVKQEAPAPAAAASPSSGGGNYYIQLASGPASADTQGTWSKLKGKYPDTLAGLSPSFQPVNIPGKGDYVRIQAGPMSQAEAADRCAKLRGADPKGACLVVRR